MKKKKLERNSKMMKEGKLSYKSIPIAYRRLITLKGNTQGKEINIAINTSDDENYINVSLESQLLIPESNIG